MGNGADTGPRLYLTSTTAIDSEAAFLVRDNTTSPNSGNIALFYDGSASFKGRAAVGAEDLDNYALVAKNEALNPTIYARNYLDDSRALVFGGYNSGSTTVPTSSIFASGSAEFAGNVYSNTIQVGKNVAGFTAAVNAIGNTDDLTSGVVAARNYSSGNIYIGLDSAGSRVFQVNSAGEGYFAGGTTLRNVTINLEADDNTKYTTTTDSEGEVTRVYNGAVLDVKDRLQNVLARMDAIEANEITDDATDSALLTLIASLTARLDERDTAIAALTARVSTLES
jgi:hypothetical protein